MAAVLRGITERNPIWMIPLALPLALHASQGTELAVVFSIAVSVVILVSVAVTAGIERWVPQDYVLVTLVVVAATVVTVVELVLGVLGVPLSRLSTYLLRSVAVCGLLVHPGAIGRRREPFTPRMVRVMGLALGFVLGLALLTAGRQLLRAAGVSTYQSVAVGLFLLALGRIVINAIRVSRGRRRSS